MKTVWIVTQNRRNGIETTSRAWCAYDSEDKAWQAVESLNKESPHDRKVRTWYEVSSPLVVL